jgi:hypothetical protein
MDADRAVEESDWFAVSSFASYYVCCSAMESITVFVAQFDGFLRLIHGGTSDY